MSLFTRARQGENNGRYLRITKWKDTQKNKIKTEQKGRQKIEGHRYEDKETVQ
jgi:hypothetical protein